jgi:hypothetical protein
MLALMLKLQLAHLASDPVLVEVAIHIHDAKARVVQNQAHSVNCGQLSSILHPTFRIMI